MHSGRCCCRACCGQCPATPQEQAQARRCRSGGCVCSLSAALLTSLPAAPAASSQPAGDASSAPADESKPRTTTCTCVRAPRISHTHPPCQGLPRASVRRARARSTRTRRKAKMRPATLRRLQATVPPPMHPSTPTCPPLPRPSQSQPLARLLRYAGAVSTYPHLLIVPQQSAPEQSAPAKIDQPSLD